MTYRQMGSMGARIGAFFLDQLFLTLILCASIPYGLFPLLAVTGNLLYFGFFEGSGLHASLGKRLCGLIVVDREGVPLDFGRAFLRSLCRACGGEGVEIRGFCSPFLRCLHFHPDGLPSFTAGELPLCDGIS